MNMTRDRALRRRKRSSLTAPLSFRIDAEIAALIDAEADDRDVDRSTIVREYLEASIYGNETESSSREILEQISALNKLTESLNALEREIGAKLTEFGRSQKETDAQIEKLAETFKSGFEKLAEAFFKLQDYIEKYCVR